MKDTLTARTAPEPEPFRVATEVVIFTVWDDTLRVLLRRLDTDSADGALWALPGGYVGAGESLDDCAGRTLAQQTGMRDVYLEQLYTFGQPDRHPASRVVSVAYYALVSGDRASAVEGGPGGCWWNVAELPGLYLDHAHIIATARERLAAKLEYSTIAFQLMPESFTLSELQQVYEIICDRSIDKRNFRKRVLSMEHIEATGKKRRNGSHRPARLYRYTARDAIQYLK